jgi:hypothetical protein
MSFHIGTQNAGVVNNVGGDQHITGGSRGLWSSRRRCEKHSTPFVPRSPPPTWTVGRAGKQHASWMRSRWLSGRRHLSRSA